MFIGAERKVSQLALIKTTNVDEGQRFLMLLLFFSMDFVISLIHVIG